MIFLKEFMCSSQKFFIMPLEFQISQIILFFFSSEKHWVVELIEPDCLPLYEYGCMPCPRPPTRRKKRSHIYGRRGAWAVLQAVLPKLVERKVCVPRVRGRPACLWSVSRQCRFKPSVAGTLPLCSLIAVSQVSGHGCQEARAVFTHFGVLESRKAPGCG